MFKKLVNLLTILGLFPLFTFGNKILDSSTFSNLYDSAWHYSEQQDYIQSLQFLNKLENNIDTSSKYQMKHLPKIFNLLGIINMNIGNYSKSIEYLERAKEQCTDTSLIALIYMNLGSVMTMKGELSRVLNYYNNALILNYRGSTYSITGTLYYNIGYAYLKVKRWKEVIYYTKESLSINITNNDKDIGYSYLNLAIAYQNLDKIDSASFCFQNAIACFTENFGKNNYNTALAYMDYADFLLERGSYIQSRSFLEKALAIFLKTFGEHHYNTSNCYVKMGKLSVAKEDYHGALNYYQKALIAKIKEFNNPDIYSFPKPDVPPDLDLIELFNRKAQAFEKLSGETEPQKNLEAALENIQYSINVIEKLRQGYISESSKLQLTENENKVYTSGLRLAAKLYDLTDRKEFLERAFEFAERTRYGILRELRSDIDARISTGIPDSLARKERKIATEIEECRVFIAQESRKENIGSEIVQAANIKLFELSRQQEKLIEEFEHDFPEYYQLKYSGKIISTRELREFLSPQQALIEYAIQDSLIYTFVITRDTFCLVRQAADTAFYNQLAFYKKFLHSEYSLPYSDYRRSAYSLYLKLIQPIERHLVNKELLLVTDAQLSQISFEALLTSLDGANPMNMYKAEPYLLQKYSIGYALSCNMLLNSKSRKFPFWKNFIGFAPDYTHSPDSLANIPEGFGSLRKIARMFFGKSVLENQATESRFKEDHEYNIVNFYTHGTDDSLNPSLSRMYFAPGEGSSDDGYLYAYEISNMRIDANLVVLITCFSGSGAVSKGEGVLSIGRSFANSGTASMVLSLWSVPSSPAFKIIKEFYRNLLAGKTKTESLRLAKLKYLEGTSPIGAHPKNWSGLVLIGNPEPIFHHYIFKLLVIPVFIILLAAIIILRKRTLRKSF